MIAVVVPNWNGQEHISECLKSLLAQTQKASIIVVDNGSVDDSVQIARKQSPKVEVIELKTNRGFAGGVNAGVKRAMERGAEFVALFNNDAVADKNWLKNLLTAAEDPKVGIVTSKFLQHENRKLFDSTGDFYSIWGFPFPRGRNQKDEGQFNQLEEIFAASGGASLYRVKMLDKIGLFDEDFFAYYEDVDLSFRAQLAGWNVMYQPKALAYHRIGATSSKLPNFARYHTIKNFTYLYVKNMPGWLFWKYLPLAVIGYSMMFANSILRGQLLVFLRADLKAAAKFFQTLAKRRKVQKLRQVPISYIDSMLYRGFPPRQGRR